MNEIDYKGLLEKASASLGAINRIATEFARFELAPRLKEELDEILDLSSRKAVKKIIGTNEPKYAYAELINNLIQAEDNLSEVEILTSAAVREAYALPDDDRKEFFDELGIEEPLDPEESELSHERQAMLSEMLSISSQIIDESESYYSPELEDYLDAV